ncbi:MAG: T9SS type A sorting domain-containing protein [Prevotella sp.]|nr:T9SS type A sorting domain-containing protein [Prevotella sp.]
MKHFYSTTRVLITLCLTGITSLASAQGDSPTATTNGQTTASDRPTTELLDDQFFYSFNQGKPLLWQTAGTVTQLSGSDRYSSDTGYGVGIETPADTEGFIKQTIDLTRDGQTVTEGDELECLIHYYTAKSERADGPFRLALRWLDASGNEVASSEKDFINNPDLYFGRMKAYGELKFRTVCPAGARKLEFSIVIAPGSQVRMDDFSVLRLAAIDKTPLVAIIPQFRTITGEVGKPETYPIAVQGMHLAADQTPNFSGTNASSVMRLDIEKLPKNGTMKANLTMTPAKKGVYDGGKAYKLKFDGADPDNTGTLTLTSYIKAAGTTPVIKLKDGIQVRNMKAAPGKTDEQVLEFDIKDVITDVKLAISQQANGPFRLNSGLYYYAPTSEKLYQSPLKVTFAPKEAGDYEATLTVTTIMADTLTIHLKGIAKAENADELVERFSADQTMDSRFKGDSWTNYHKFDQGYWKLDGTWNAAGNATLTKDGTLYYDELLPNGISTVTLEPAASAAKCKAEYSIDGGGHWTELAAADNTGKFTVGTHRPTLIRFVAKDDAEINTVVISPNAVEERQSFSQIEDAMLKSADSTPLSLLKEDFSNLRHTRILGLKGWQNITVRGERPFYAWQQKDAAQTKVENEVAQISFLKYGVVDEREHETWLISPTLSYQQAANKILTFSLMFRNPTTDGKESFGLYLITEKNGEAKAQYLDLADYAPANVTLEADTWYDYRIDLSTIDSLDIDDNFHVAYSYYSPVGGNETSLNFMIDDISFGRTDLPELSIDNDFIQFEFQAGLEATPQVFNIFTDRTTAPVTVTLVPSSMSKYFKVSASQLPAEGGVIAVGFKSDDTTARAAMLLIQSRGAEPATVKLLAQPVGTDIDGVSAAETTEPAPALTGNGLRINGKYTSFQIFSTTGQLLRQGGYQENIETEGIQPGIVVLKLATDAGTRSFKINIR